jgi:hypothetical protein
MAYSEPPHHLKGTIMAQSITTLKSVRSQKLERGVLLGAKIVLSIATVYVTNTLKKR